MTFLKTLPLIVNSSSNPPSSSDPYWSNVSLLMHMDTPAMSDQKGNIPNITGTPYTELYKKFGSGSFVSLGGLISFSSGSNIQPRGTEDFTIEGFIYPTNNTSLRSIVVSGFPLQFYNNAGKLEVYLSTTNSSPYFISGAQHPSSIILNTWSHFAFVRHGSQFILYLNGVGVGVGTSTASIALSTAPFEIGANNGSFRFAGYIDEVRITRGVARYLSDFTPTSSPFPDSA